MKSYATLHTAKKAIATAGLAAMTVRYDTYAVKKVLPVVLCDLIEDKREVEERGFKAEMKFTDFGEGATVMLKPSVPSAKKGELAVIRNFIKDIDGGVYLDRRIGGTHYWNVRDLILIAREEEDA